MINCEIELDLKWAKYFAISDLSRTFRAVNQNTNPIVYEKPIEITTATFQVNNAKFCVPVVALSVNDNITSLENIKPEFETNISWNKYKSKFRFRFRFRLFDWSYI